MNLIKCILNCEVKEALELIKILDYSDLNFKDWYGDTALLLASRYNHTEIVKELLTKCDHSAINIRNKYGDTPLTLACYHEHAVIIKELIYISDIHIRDNRNKTAFDLSREKVITDLFDLNTGCDTSLKKGKSLSNKVICSLHSLKSDRWLNLF